MDRRQIAVCTASIWRACVFFAGLILAGTMTSCSGGSPTPQSSSPPSLQSITVSPSDPSVIAGLTEQYSATGNFSDGSTQNLTGSATWTSSNATAATINAAGLATTLTGGTTTIEAKFQSIAGSTLLTVTPPVLQSIAISPINSSVIAGTTEQYSVTGTYSNGSTQDVTSLATWTSSNATVANISATGLATTLTEGGTAIKASVQSFASSTLLTATALAVQVSVVATDSTGHTLSYRWQATDGTIQNVDAATTTWTLPDGPGLHFAYVLVSNGVGGYTERRAVVSTDTIGTPLHVLAPVPFAPPTKPPSPTPANIFRGFITGGQLSTVTSFPGAVQTWPGGIPLSVPDVPLYASSLISPVINYPVTTTNVRGEFVFPNVPPPFVLLGGPTILSGEDLLSVYPANNVPIPGLTSAISAYSSPGFNVFTIQALNASPANVAGEVLLQDGSPCGTVNEFFGVEVVASATLLNGSGQVMLGPIRANQWGDYDLPYMTGATSVSLACENAPAITIPISNPSTTGTTQLPLKNFPGAAPSVTSMTAVLGSTTVGQLLAPDTGGPSDIVPSDIVPLADAFLAEKGLDTRIGACQYYLAVGAVKTCDAEGNFTGAITFEDWKSQVQIDEYAPATPNLPALGGSPVYTATYINEEDLNIARNHHSAANGLPANLDVLSQAPYTILGTYVCNHSGPTGPNALNPPQSGANSVDSVIQDTVNGKNLIACVAMDYSTFPVSNPLFPAVMDTYGPYIRFLIFGPNGQLLPSINLDTRREKFVPGTCVACHGGDHYAGPYPEDGTGSPDVGGHFLPYDTGNFEFSSQAGLTEADQEQVIYYLNQNLMVDGAQALTAAEAKLIQGWYAQSSGGSGPPLNKNYVDPSWHGQTLGGSVSGDIVYQNVYARSCRSCHVALPAYNFETLSNLLHSPPGPIVDPGNCGALGLDRNRMYKMPNSLVTFNQFWLSPVSNLTVPATVEPLQGSIFHEAFGCSGTSAPFQ